MLRVALYTIPVVLLGVLGSGVATLYYQSHYPVDLRSVSRDLGRRMAESEYCGSEQAVSGKVEEIDPEAKYYFLGDGRAVLKVNYSETAPKLGDSLRVRGRLFCYTEHANDSVIAVVELAEASRSR